MKTYIEDDVLFTQQNTDDLLFELDAAADYTLTVRNNDGSFIGEIGVHYDEDAEENLVDEGIEVHFEDIHYIYINNELIHLNNLLDFYWL